ncbi:tetratricopeptide repeat protein [Streptomyces sp. NPDC090036]|uniref:tetratricopeptide repeat protein n=1 Tax=Streptomyces sp. NPDC090036 TaxID=3365926 RepID=UPI0037F8D369
MHTTLTTPSRTPEPKAEQPPQPGPDPTHSTLVDDFIKDADTTGYGGDHVRAAQLALTAAEVATRILGPDHRTTLTTRHNHAHWTGVIEQSKR